MPDGSQVVVPENFRHKPYKEIMPRESLDGEYIGKVVKFIWDKGFGYIRVDVSETPIPKEHQIENNEVYFNWSDLSSSDKVVGVNTDIEVKFGLYKDSKGLGAENITLRDGSALSEQTRPKSNPSNHRR